MFLVEVIINKFFNSVINGFVNYIMTNICIKRFNMNKVTSEHVVSNRSKKSK